MPEEEVGQTQDILSGADEDTQEYLGEPIVHQVRRKSSFNYCPFQISIDIYNGCTNACAYCFSKTRIDSARNRFLESRRQYKADGVMRHFKKIIETKEIGLYKFIKSRMPVELSILTDAFQAGLELKQGASLKTLKFLNSIHYPVVICSKSVDTLARPEYWDELMKAHRHGKRLLFKTSISSFDDAIAKRLEPGAPAPSERLAFVKRLRREGVGCILRVQPMILGHSLETLKKNMKVVKATGVQRIIAEPLRVSKVSYDRQFKTIFEVLNIPVKDYFKEYGSGGSFGSASWIEYDHNIMRREFMAIKEVVNENGMLFSPTGSYYGWPNLDLADMKRYCCEVPGYENLAIDTEALTVRFAQKRLSELTLDIKDRTEYYIECSRAEFVNNPAQMKFW